MRDIPTTVSVISAFSAATASSLGIIPKVGAVRALTLAFHSKIRGMRPTSQRIKDVHALQRELTKMKKGNYIVVTGAKGIGKSCVIDTVTSYTCGVVSLKVHQATPAYSIIQNALMRLTKTRIPYWDLHAATKRVLFFYNLFARSPPIVVFQVSERMDKGEYAEIPGAARDLADLGLRVLVDGSTNSIPFEALNTKRELVLDLDPMTQETLENITDLKDVIDILKKKDLFDVVWAVIGGVPSDFITLCENIKYADQKDIESVVESFLQMMITKSSFAILRTRISHPQIDPILKKFKEVDEILLKDFLKERIQRPSPDKVLREKMRGGKVVLVPVDSAMAFVLKHNLCVVDEAPSLEKLKTLMSDDSSCWADGE